MLNCHAGNSLPTTPQSIITKSQSIDLTSPSLSLRFREWKHINSIEIKQMNASCVPFLGLLGWRRTMAKRWDDGDERLKWNNFFLFINQNLLYILNVQTTPLLQWCVTGSSVIFKFRIYTQRFGIEIKSQSFVSWRFFFVNISNLYPTS